MKTNEYNMIHAYIAFLCVTFRFNTLLFFLSCCNGCMYSCVCVCVSIRMQFVLSLLLFVISFVPWNCLFHVEFDRFVFHLYHECVQYSSVERQSKQYAIISERQRKSHRIEIEKERGRQCWYTRMFSWYNSTKIHFTIFISSNRLGLVLLYTAYESLRLRLSLSLYVQHTFMSGHFYSTFFLCACFMFSFIFGWPKTNENAP